MSVTSIQVKIEGLQRMAEASRVAPQALLISLANAYNRIGRYDIDELRSTQLQGGSHLKSVNKSTANAFRFNATDPSRADDPSKIFVNEWSKWKGAGLHEEGGEVAAKPGHSLLILNELGRGATGKRRFTEAQIKAGLETGKFFFTKHHGGSKVYLMWQVSKSRCLLIGTLERRVTLKKRLDWLGMIEKNADKHTEFIQEAIDTTLQEALGGQ